MEVLSSFKPTKTLHYHAEAAWVASLDFDDTGLWCLTCSPDDESIQLYDCKSGKHNKTIYSKKYGCNLARFSHNSMNCVYASTKEDGT
jgi:COMPASS component SWD2